jgi:hypothetical protein
MDIKAKLIMNDGTEYGFASVQELIEYISDNKLLSLANPGKNLLKIWNHDSEKFAIDTSLIYMIILTYGQLIIKYELVEKSVDFSQKEAYNIFQYKYIERKVYFT